jgi:hypothetical protein
MQTDPLKLAWNADPEEQTSNIKIKNPVLKDIRRQLTIESIIYTVFLIAYYDGFDGDKKPFILNLLLVVSVLLLLMHNIAGYIITKNNVGNGNLKESLSTYLSKIKTYAAVSIASRALAFSGIILFFMANITWTTGKYYGLALIIGLLCFQVFSLRKIWAGRINKIRMALAEYTNV